MEHLTSSSLWTQILNWIWMRTRVYLMTLMMLKVVLWIRETPKKTWRWRKRRWTRIWIHPNQEEEFLTSSPSFWSSVRRRMRKERLVLRAVARWVKWIRRTSRASVRSLHCYSSRAQSTCLLPWRGGIQSSLIALCPGRSSCPERLVLDLWLHQENSQGWIRDSQEWDPEGHTQQECTPLSIKCRVSPPNPHQVPPTPQGKDPLPLAYHHPRSCLPPGATYHPQGLQVFSRPSIPWTVSSLHSRRPSLPSPQLSLLPHSHHTLPTNHSHPSHFLSAALISRDTPQWKVEYPFKAQVKGHPEEPSLLQINTCREPTVSPWCKDPLELQHWLLHQQVYYTEDSLVWHSMEWGILYLPLWMEVDHLSQEHLPIRWATAWRRPPHRCTRWIRLLFHTWLPLSPPTRRETCRVIPPPARAPLLCHHMECPVKGCQE